jgi:hypothetical protein
MRAFACQNCGQLVFFENTTCLNCGAALGFEPGERELITLRRSDGDDQLDRFDGEPGSFYRCANVGVAACNWLVADEGEFCASCVLTRTRPNDSDRPGIERLAAAEAAKRWLLFELYELGLPVAGYTERDGGLAFDLLSSADRRVTTGHANGVITLDLAESDDARRERRRLQLGEPYRTLLGHLRHEVGHYYYPILTAEPDARERARALFGDATTDYSEALERHYEQGPPDDWRASFVSAYATMHPSEDWAETFAHYLHIQDTLQTAAEYRVRVDGPDAVAKVRPTSELRSTPREGERPFSETLAEWLPLTYALNALNRSMGRDDLYPFVLPPPVVEKLALVDELVTGYPQSGPGN